MNTTDVIPLIPEPAWDYYKQKANELFEACKSVDTGTIQLVRKYHPNPEKVTDINRPNSNFTLDDASLILAREHGFETTESLREHISELSSSVSLTYQFEHAVDAIVNGNLSALKQLVEANPELVHARSSRGHKATLLHYVAANGVENYRQKSPPNAVEIAEFLLYAGSTVDSVADVYNGKWGTPLELLVSSRQAARAGVQIGLIHKLIEYGAAINGQKNDSSPLIAAIHFHYTKSAEELVRLGAKVDNLVLASAMGMTQLVAGYLDEHGKMLPGAPLFRLDWLDIPGTPEANVDLALVWAAMNNRAETVSFLLEKGVSVSSRDHQQWTALHWASYLGYPEIVRLLMAKKAPLEARNEYGGTVLDQTLWATIHKGVGEHHVEIIRNLIDSGAKIHSWWLFAGLTPPLDPRVEDVLQSYEL